MENVVRIVKLAILSTALLLSGCGGILGNTSRSVYVTSVPDNAPIYVDYQILGHTPANISLPNYIYGGKAITVDHDECEESTQIVHAEFNQASVLNVIFWPGWFIDIITGNIVKISEDDRSLVFILTPLK